MKEIEEYLNNSTSLSKTDILTSGPDTRRLYDATTSFIRNNDQFVITFNTKGTPYIILDLLSLLYDDLTWDPIEKNIKTLKINDKPFQDIKNFDNIVHYVLKLKTDDYRITVLTSEELWNYEKCCLVHKNDPQLNSFYFNQELKNWKRDGWED